MVRAQGDRRALQHLVDSLQQRRNGTLTLVPRTYPLAGPLVFDRARNLTLDGRGATRLIAHRRQPGHAEAGISLASPKNITLRNLTLDFSPLPFSQSVVRRVASTYCDVALDAGYPQDSAQFAGQRRPQVAAGVFRVVGPPALVQPWPKPIRRLLCSRRRVVVLRKINA